MKNTVNSGLIKDQERSASLSETNQKGLIQISVCLLCLLVLTPVDAKTNLDKWNVYENKYFTIFSNAKENKVLKTLTGLEKFRLLVERGLKVKIPDHAPRTEVYLFASKREFRKYGYSSQLAGYMATMGGVPTIVMPATSRGADVENVIRHEYVHAVQAYDPGETPKWMTEGIAEMFATAEYHENIGMIGSPNRDRWEYLYREINYDKIIDDEFDGLRFRAGADAYAQYWLLVNYSLTHNDGQYRESLGRYLYLYRSGVPSIDAFISAYGMTPNELAKEAMSNYGRRSYSYLRVPYVIDLESMDLDIAPRKPNQTDLDRRLLDLESRAESIKQSRKKKK